MRLYITLLLTLIISVLVLLSAVFIGSDYSSLVDGITSEQLRSIIINVRLPRVIASFFIGGILALGGLVFQSLFRNPLATPYTLGSASGASFGAALYYALGMNSIFPTLFGAPIFTFLGAFLTVIVVSLVSRASRDNNIVLLMGVALSFIFSSLIMFIQYVTDLHLSQQLLRFTFGAMDGISYSHLILLFPVCAITFFIIVSFRREINMISISDEFASSRGVNVDNIKITLYIVVSIMIGTVVSIAGPIGFVGMMIPHIMRSFLGSDSKYFIYMTFVVGGLFLTICDTVSRIIISPIQLPVGIVTSMIGGTFFIFLLINNIRRSN